MSDRDQPARDELRDSELGTREADRGEGDREEELATTDAHRNPPGRGKYVSALVALVGAWLLVEPLALRPAAGNFWSDVIVGLALVALGSYNYVRRRNDRLGSFAVGGFVALLGLWQLVTPFLLGGETGLPSEIALEPAVWNDVLVGLLVVVLGAYSASEARRSRAARPARR